MPYNLYNQAGIMIPPGIRGFLLGGRTVITATGLTNYSPPKTCKFLFFQLVGGGGGGGTTLNSAAGQCIVAGGGTGAAYAEFSTFAYPGVYKITVGTGGAGASAGNNSTLVLPSAFTSSGVGSTSWVTASGGASGNANTSAATPGFTIPVQGGLTSSTVGGLAAPGRPAYEAYRHSGTVARSGRGGDSVMGFGAIARLTQGNGNNGIGFGGGGGGGVSFNAGGAATGGSGSNGIAIVWEYY